MFFACPAPAEPAAHKMSLLELAGAMIDFCSSLDAPAQLKLSLTSLGNAVIYGSTGKSRGSSRCSTTSLNLFALEPVMVDTDARIGNLTK